MGYFWPIFVIIDWIVWFTALIAVMHKYGHDRKLADACSDYILYPIRNFICDNNLLVAGSFKFYRENYRCLGTKWHRSRNSSDKSLCFDFCTLGESSNPFFRRPKPVLSDKVLDSELYFDDKIPTTEGEYVSHMGGTKTQLWMNVTNRGKTSVKRMRARGRFYPIPKKIHAVKYPRPAGLSEEEWTKYKQQHQQFEERLQEEYWNNMYGRPLPFSSTPKGTVSFPWSRLDRFNVFETDLPPNSDEAGALICAIYRPRSMPLPSKDNPEVINQNIRIDLQVGGIPVVVLNPRTRAEIKFSFAVKFWIIAENLTEQISEILHVEIPDSYETIACRRLKKGTKEYKDFDELLSV